MSFLNIWCLLGTATLIFEVVMIHRHGGTLRQICAFAAIEAIQAGHARWIAALVGHRRYVVPMMVGLWPVVLALRLGGRA